VVSSTVEWLLSGEEEEGGHGERDLQD